MNTQAAIQAIQTEQLKNIYLVFGTEKFLQEQIRQAFVKRLKVTTDDLNFAHFDLEKDSFQTVLNEAEALPFFGDQRLIFVERPYFLTAEKKANLVEQDADGWLRYFQAPVESTILVIFAAYDKLDARKKVTKQLKKAAETIDVQPLDEQSVRRYLQQTMDNDGFAMKRGTFDLFLRLTDVNLSKAMQELQKIYLFAGEKKSITEQELTKLIPKTLEHDIFDFTADVLAGNVEDALKIYQDLLLQGEETIKINAILIGQVRLLLQTKLLMKQGYQQAKIAETIKVHPYRVKLAMQQVKNYPERILIELFDELVENDYLVKTGKMDKEFLFQLFVLKTGSR
ncbi:MAG: DNA polymerase III subunit delta [Enterococcus sp.]